MRIKKAWAVVGFILLAFGARAAFAPSESTFDHGDPAMSAGPGPGNLTCGRCHNDFPLIVVDKLDGDFTLDDRGGNMGSQGLELFTRGYVPGQTYQMRAVIQSPDGTPGLSSWGFEAWAIDMQGATAGTLAGFPNRTTTHTRMHDGVVVASVWNEGVRYRQNGRYDGPVGWRFRWTAPATDIGPIRFFAEGTAADRDRTPRGDYSYYLNGITVNAAK